MLFAVGAHGAVWQAYRAEGGELSPATLERARGWAVHFGVMLLLSGLVDEDPEFTAVGRWTLDRAVPSPG